MHEIEILRELVVVFGAALVVALVLGRLRLPTIAGFLVAGALLGPSGLAGVKDPRQIEQLAEIGVVLLLFTIGLAFSLSDLRKMGRLLVIGGDVQVILTTGVVAAWAVAAGYAPAKSLFLGFLVVGLTLVLARRVVPFGLRVVSRTRRRDLFILAVVVVCAGIAWLTSHPRHFSRAKPRQRSPQSR